MRRIIFDGEFFNVKDTLECGQIFRFFPEDGGYYVVSGDKAAFCRNDGNDAVIECEDADAEYFANFFDLSNDYKSIVSSAKNCAYPFLGKCAEAGKGIRILNQDKTEILFSFIVSQNNNIPRIKVIIERLCANLGEKKTFYGKDFYAFPNVGKMAEADLSFYKSIGLGYRAEYIKKLADDIAGGFNPNELSPLDTAQLKTRLLSLYGVGPKVADCVALFGYHRLDSFPVDTWIEKVYRENLNGTIKDRKKIAEFLVGEFGGNSGYFQQYMFYYKRSIESTSENRD